MENEEIYTAEMYKNLVSTMSSDMKFVGIVSIVYGAINCIFIVTAIIGIPIIFAGIRLKEAAFHFKNYAGSDDMAALKHAHERLSRTFNIVKILLIIYIAISVLSILSFLMIFLFMGSQVMDAM